MKVQTMITGIKQTDYLPNGFFKDNEAALTPEEKLRAMVKGWDILAVEGGSDTIFHYRIAAALAPEDMGKWAFRAAEFDCSGATGRTWANGQKGPMEADVTFTAVAIKQIDLAVVQKEAERRMEQAKTESDAYKQQRAALTTLEAQVRQRLTTAQATPATK